MGDKVIVQKSADENGREFFVILDYDRQSYLFWLAVIFCAIILIISRKKGIRALISLAISFIILIKFVLPRILAGGNPLWWGLVSSFLILMFIIYLTEGWNKKSHLAIVSVFFSLVIIFLLSWILLL